MIHNKELSLLIAFIFCLQGIVCAQTEKKKPYPINFSTTLKDPTLYLNEGLLCNTDFTFEDTIQFDKNARIFILQEGRIVGATRPMLNFYGWDAITTWSILDCYFDFLRLPVGDYTLVIPAGTLWWKSDSSIKNDIIERPICVPDYLHIKRSTPENGDTIKSLKKISVTYHCDIMEESNPCITLYENEKPIGTYALTVINDFGDFSTAEADFGTTKYFKKGVKYCIVIEENAFSSKYEYRSMHLSNKFTRIDFIGGQ